MVEIADLDRDGKPDLIVPLSDDSSIAVLLNDTDFPQEPFRRGDANDDGTMNIADAIFVLGFLFGGQPEPGCYAAANANNDNSVNIADAIFILGNLFGGGPEPDPPFEFCGVDLDDLTCVVFESCP
jgi:hypothetical protein